MEYLSLSWGRRCTSISLRISGTLLYCALHRPWRDGGNRGINTGWWILCRLELQSLGWARSASWTWLGRCAYLEGAFRTSSSNMSWTRRNSGGSSHRAAQPHPWSRLTASSWSSAWRCNQWYWRKYPSDSSFILIRLSWPGCWSVLKVSIQNRTPRCSSWRQSFVSAAPTRTAGRKSLARLQGKFLLRDQLDAQCSRLQRVKIQRSRTGHGGHDSKLNDDQGWCCWCLLKKQVAFRDAISSSHILRDIGKDKAPHHRKGLLPNFTY